MGIENININGTNYPIGGGTGFSTEFKIALENLLNNVAFTVNNPTGQTYINALHTAMYPPENLAYITAVYTQYGTVYDTDPIDTLRYNLVVTAHFYDSTTESVTAYGLSGTLSVGTSTVTVYYGGKTTTFTVTVTWNDSAHPLYPFENGSHTFSSNNRTLTVTNGNHFVYTNPSAALSGGGAYINLSSVSSNDTTGNSITNVSDTGTAFTIPANASVVIKVQNITATRLDSGKFNISLIHNGTGTGLAIEDHTTLDNITVTTTVSEDTPVTCVWAYIKNSYSEFAADVELYVNDARWI